jgi:regulator of protease activity HflC (stomatin/prohibitin superfamily)
MSFLVGIVIGFVLVWPLFRLFLKIFGLFTVVEEAQVQVYILFGKVLGIFDTPGVHVPLFCFGPKAILVPFFGSVRTVSNKLDQVYIRSQPVNSEEGTPMGIGIWYEMSIGNAVDYLFKNADPDGSLRANVSNSTVRCLSNMPLQKLLTERHAMSRSVREEVSPKANEWGYRLGSVYVRKVHFRDANMIKQIEHKVVNRLRQVTSAIRQAGTNQVNIIMSKAEKESSAEFAHAAAMRPQIVGVALKELSQDPGILDAVFDIMECRKMLVGNAEIVMMPDGLPADVATGLLASRPPQAPSRSSPPAT